MLTRTMWQSIGKGLLLAATTMAAGTAWCADATSAGAVFVEPPTLISLGFEWPLRGDDNRNATASIEYRKRGETAWRQGPALLRIGGERINENALQYVTSHMFAGSLFDLEPGTAYDVHLVMADVDGLAGQAEQQLVASTRAEPVPAAGGKVYHVYPADYKGEKLQPAFSNLLAAYYTGSSGSDNFNT